MDALHPYDVLKLAVGPGRVLFAPVGDVATPPAKLQDIIALESEYDPVEKWVDFGAIPDGEAPSYTRGFEAEETRIEQETSALYEDITDFSRGISVNVAEIDPTNVKVIEGTDAATVEVAAAKETSAQEAIPIGSVSELPQYRVALIWQRRLAAGIVKESDGTTERGRFVAIVLNRCQLAADETEIEVAGTGLVSAPISFQAFPEPEVEAAKSHGYWLLEKAGTNPSE